MADMIARALAESAKSGSINVKDFGALGKYTDDTVAIQSAINAISTLGGGEVIVPPGNYNISATIEIKSNVHLRCSHGVTLRPKSDIHMIKIRKNGQLSGPRLETYDLADFTKSCIYLDGSDLYAFDHNTVIRNVVIYGKYGRVTTPEDRGGTGIYFHATGDGSNICGVRVYDVSIIYVGKGIHLHAENAGDGTSQWVNGNQFSMISFSGVQYDIYMEGTIHRDPVHNGTYQVSGNTFVDLQTQTFTSITKKVYVINGAYNRIITKVWDIQEVKSGILAEFTKFTLGNIITSNLEKKHVIDAGRQNKVDAIYESNDTFTGTFSGTMTSGMLIPPVTDVHLMAGNQDNFLAFADKRFTVTQKQGPSIDMGNLPNIFDLIPNSVARWDVSVDTTPIVIEILFPSTISYLGNFGISYGIYNESPKNLKLEKLHQGSWTTEFEYTNLPSKIHITKDRLNNYVDGLRITMSGTNAASGKLRMYRIFAQTSDAPGAAYLQAAGGPVYGTIDMRDNFIIIGNKTSLPTASARYRGHVVMLQGSKGVEDALYMCIKNSSDAYVWKKIN
ncbi:glycosyl hydrolase family 28-related protein [Paenibacillus oceani]|uniref:Rhamnogalacturonase A/B/Epimerase-like pectate lyase domain-containing protein n=1 Tax=Paenibacillus oceani TaxID=2772510 RepID=A0A927H2F2_9BACL|nr:glycosyl hydrolase family 28-related protein [Paenibacillus oceani]MBD2866191.1 hypothetical protein [Paenibacillus oceani]